MRKTLLDHGKDVGLLDVWFKMDSNALPTSVYLAAYQFYTEALQFTRTRLAVRLIAILMLCIAVNWLDVCIIVTKNFTVQNWKT